SLYQEGIAQLPASPAFVLDRFSCLLRGSEIAHRRGFSQDAVARAQAAESVMQQSLLRSDAMELTALIDLATAYSGAGRQRDAISTFARASALLTVLGRDQTQEAATLFNNWGITLWIAGRSLEAEQVFRRSIAISEDNRGEI